jgi:integrase
MPLELKAGSGLWYGRVQVNKKRVLIALGVPVRGKRPVSLREQGDPPFEVSRARAQVKLDEMERKLRETGNEQQLTERLLYLKQGVEYQTILLADLYDTWIALSPGKRRSPRYLAQLKSLCEQFAKFAANREPPALEMTQVSVVLAEDFVASLERTGVAGKTRNEKLSRLNTLFKDLASRSGVVRNPFGEIKKLKVETTFRQPLTIEQIIAVLKAVEDDPFVRALIVTALCTAMRRCDCCLLRFDKIKWRERMIAVKPAKNGNWVSIPIQGRLERELAPLFQGKQPRPNDYVFPDQAATYLANPDGITWRVKKALERAGFAWDDDDPDSHGMAMTVKRQHGVRRASVIGFHSLRTSWITLALMSGVPIELVQQVTGQKSTEVIRTHYFKPLDSQVRDALSSKMHPLLAGKQPVIDIEAKPAQSANDRIRELLSSMTDSNWQQVRDELLSLFSA